MTGVRPGGRRGVRGLWWVGGMVATLLVVALLGWRAFGWMTIDPYRDSTPYDPNQPSLALDTELTREQALEDLTFARDSIAARHVSAVGGLPEGVRTAYDAQVAALPERPTVLAVWRAVSAIAHPLGDGHSVAAAVIPNEPRAADRFTVDGTALHLADGARVTALNGVPTDRLWEQYQQLGSDESPAAARYSFASMVGLPSRLAWLGAPGEGVQVTTAGGTRSLPMVPPRPSRGGPVAAYRFEADLGVLVIHSCTPGAEYSGVLKDFFAAVAQRGVRRIVVDLRDNGGGDSTVANEFLRWLDVDRYRTQGSTRRYGPWLRTSEPEVAENARVAEPYRGEVFVATSPVTFSSAVIFTYLLRDNNLATVVGEAPANNPTSYGDVISYRLPHTRLAWQTTWKLFIRASGDTDATRQLVPDLEVPAAEAIETIQAGKRR